ncbi:MAG: hypothetical protein IJE08_13230 [Clostridia bacterium]|nr:hypothetical protein [Clostridia bacterium]
MKFHFADEKLSYVELMFTKIADQYLKMLGANFLFRAKLDVLEVFVDGDKGEDHFQGNFWFDDANNRCEINLHITPELSEAETALLIAHELGHLMISNMGVGLLERGRNDDIIVRLGVMRSEGRGEIVGVGLEEGIVEFMASEVIARISENWANELKRSEFKKGEASLAGIAEALSKCFGKRLQRMERFDQTTNIGKKVVWSDNWMRPAEVTSVFHKFDNLFWQCLARQSFGLVETIYDEVMGAGEFRDLCIQIEAVYSPFKETPPTAEEMLILQLFGDERGLTKEIHEKIAAFRKLKAKKDRESEGISEIKVAGDSVKMAFDVMKQYCRMLPYMEGYDEYKADVEAFLGTLNKGRVWKCIPDARAALKRIDGRDLPILARHCIEKANKAMDAVCEVAEFYKKSTAADASDDQNEKA